MSYYGAKGDFYGGGGYYRGDPGFLGGLLRTVAPIAASFIPGVGGLAARGVTALLGSGGGGGTPAAQSFAAPIQTQQPTISAAGSAAMPARTRGRGTLTGRLSGIARRALPTMAGAGSLGTRGAAPVAMHPAVAAALGGRRRKRMNPCNHKALRRAIRRAHSFERIAKQVIGFSSPHRKTGRVYFKRKRRARR
jgi:hypothetical protein